MSHLVTTQAYRAFVRGHYHAARNAYMSAAKRLGSRLFQANLQFCDRLESRAFLRERSEPTETKEPLITYCVPVMNRLDDLRKTLGANLNVLSAFRRARMMINVFEETDDTADWIRSEFTGALDSGRLVFNQLPPMDEWHMSRGKNSFQPFLGDEGWYSSLDSDNYLSTDEVVKTKQAIAEFGSCLIHHFSGHWGDGTCGRITVPAGVYRRTGYTKALYPRQFDELSLIANVIAAQPELQVVTRHGVNVLQKTLFLREFIALNGHSPRVIPCTLGNTQSPENGKDIHYAEQDLTLKYYSELNGYYAVCCASERQAARDRFRQDLQRVQNAALQSPVARKLAFKTLSCSTEKLKNFPLPEGTHFAVVDRVDGSLATWLNHQRGRGLKGFILIDATADQALGALYKSDDVLVMTPCVGDVEFFRDFWIQSAKIMVGKALPKTSTLGNVVRWERVS